mgnify:CR=1 FL=1
MGNLRLFSLKSARQVYTEAISRGAECQRNGGYTDVKIIYYYLKRSNGGGL